MTLDPPQTPPTDPAHQELELLAELAPLGVLDPEAHRRLGEHVNGGCLSCARTIDRAWASLDVLALATPVLVPSPDRRATLLEAVGGGEPAAVGRGSSVGLGWLVAAGLAALAVGLGLMNAQQLERERGARTAVEAQLASVVAEQADLADRNAALEAEQADLAARNVVLENAVDVLGGPELRTVLLSGQSEFAEARVRVLFDPELERTVLLARELPPPPPGSTYQLWVVDGGKPSSLGVFQPDALGRALELERGVLDRPNERLFAVSVEPEGGVPQPTGPIVLTGS